MDTGELSNIVSREPDERQRHIVLRAQSFGLQVVLAFAAVAYSWQVIHDRPAGPYLLTALVGVVAAAGAMLVLLRRS